MIRSIGSSLLISIIGIIGGFLYGKKRGKQKEIDKQMLNFLKDAEITRKERAAARNDDIDVVRERVRKLSIKNRSKTTG